MLALIFSTQKTTTTKTTTTIIFALSMEKLWLFTVSLMCVISY